MVTELVFFWGVLTQSGDMGLGLGEEVSIRGELIEGGGGDPGLLELVEEVAIVGIVELWEVGLVVGDRSATVLWEEVVPLATAIVNGTAA